MTAFLRMRSLLCWHYLFSRLESSYRLAVVSVRWTLTGKKEPPTFVGGFVLALHISRPGQAIVLA